MGGVCSIHKVILLLDRYVYLSDFLVGYCQVLFIFFIES